MIAIEGDVLFGAVDALRAAGDAFDTEASVAPQNVAGGAATTLVAGWVAQLCASGLEALTALNTLCEATDAAGQVLLKGEDDAATTLAFMEAGS